MTYNYIADNLAVIKEKISAAAKVSGRKPEDIQIVGVTKTRRPEEINAAIAAGITIIGENRAQELRDKYLSVDSSVRWDFIGRLQRNKVKYLIGKVTMIQSVDSLSLAQEISEQYLKAGRIIDILIEVNIGLEAAKGGILEDDIEKLILPASKLEGVRIKGLMSVIPNVGERQSRIYFEKLRKLFERISGLAFDGVDMQMLSMGMSNDFESAIAEGSTMIRLGRCLFENNVNIV